MIKEKGLWEEYSELDVTLLRKAVKEKVIELDGFVEETESYRVTVSRL